MRKTFTVRNNKATVTKEKSGNFHLKLVDSTGVVYETDNGNFYWCMSDVHELADNNEIGNKLVSKFMGHFSEITGFQN